MLERPACILEDDVVLDDRFLSVLNRVEKFVDANRSQVVLLSNHTAKRGDVEGVSIVPAQSDMYTEGYVITPRAAQALVRANAYAMPVRLVGALGKAWHYRALPCISYGMFTGSSAICKWNG